MSSRLEDADRWARSADLTAASARRIVGTEAENRAVGAGPDEGGTPAGAKARRGLSGWPCRAGGHEVDGGDVEQFGEGGAGGPFPADEGGQEERGGDGVP
jgi:hypothetical protein